MELEFQATRAFENDLTKLPKADRIQVINKINRKGQLLRSDRQAFRRGLTQPCRLKLVDGLESSLYAFRATDDLRVLLAIDDDPIFERILITLLRIVRREDLDKAYQRTAKALYQEGFLSDHAKKHSKPD